MGVEPTLAGYTSAHIRGPNGSRATPTGNNISTPTTSRPNHAPELELSPISRKVRHFDKYSRKGGRWSWKRPSYERGVVSLVKTERRIEEGIASALTEVEAVEAGLRYFDELIMPPNKTSSTTPTTVNGELRGPPALPAPPTGQFPQRRQQDSEAQPPEQPTKGRKGPGLRSKGGHGGGGFSRTQESNVRDYQAAKKTGVGRGSRITSSSDRAVSECVDLKLTLKQRLDNYDRQRGINLNSLHEDGASTASPIPAIQGRQEDGGLHVTKTRGTNSGASSSRAATMPAGSGDGQDSGALAPCYDGGILDNGSVGTILARSLGNAAAAVRRNRPGGGEGGGGNGTNKRGGGDGGDGGTINNKSLDRFAVRSRWRSWNEPPPAALLTAEEIRSLPAGKLEEETRQRRPPDVVAEVVPPLQSRRRLKNDPGNSTNSDGKKHLPGSSTCDSSRAPAAAKGTPNSEVHNQGSKDGGSLSTPSSATSRRSSVGGVPLVPRVATLSAASTADKSHTEAVRKGKDFDPDQLECVRRHEASVAEKERRVRSLRAEAEKRTHFRARPLPGFLDGVGAAGPVGRASGNGGGLGQSRRDHGSVVSARGVAGTRPELLAALEQDEEARALAEKIRKINPRADIASIVLQSTPRAPVPSQTTWNGDGGSGTERRPSSRGATPIDNSTNSAATPQSFSVKHPNMRPFVGGDGSSIPCCTSLSGTEGAAAATVAVRSGGPVTTTSARIHERDANIADSEVRSPRFPGNRESQAVGIGSRSPHARPEKELFERKSPQASNGRTFEPTAPPPDKLADGDGVAGAGGWGSVESNRRSLMGRMLGSGMLERQREWAKARNRKVLESRRQVEEAKEREAEGDILDAGRSGRSWSKAKTEHLRSLQRQKEEEEAREEARRRASELRAERERRKAEQMAADLAQTLVTAADATGVGSESGRELRTAPHSRGGGGGRRPRRPPRRARSYVGDSRVVDSTRGRGIDESAPGHGKVDSPAAAEGNNLLSEDSFYRVAVEKTMERERLGTAISDGDGDDGGASSGGRKSGGIRSSGRIRPHDEARKGVADPIVSASPRGAAAGRPGRRKSLIAPRNKRKASSTARTPQGQAAGRRRSLEGRDPTGQGRSPFENTRAQSPALSKEVARTSSLLSLYEAQSVEHVAAGGGGVPGGRDNSGPHLDFDGSAQLDLGGSVTGPFYGLERRGELVEDPITPPARRDRSQDPAAGERNASPPGTGESGEYPWSDERRVSWSRGSGGAGKRRPGRGNAAPRSPTDEPRGETRWDDVLRNDERDRLSAVVVRNGDGLPEPIDGNGGYYRDGELEETIVHSHGGLLPLPAEGADRSNGPRFLSQPSPRKKFSVQRRREYIASPTRAASRSADANQPHLNGHRNTPKGDDSLVDGVGGAGARFSLWSSSDEDANVTEVFGRDEHEDGDEDEGNCGSGYGIQAGGPNRPSSRSAAAVTASYDVSGGMTFLPGAASAGSFFDAATSSADKGRYKVRDPRLFDPCSMRRTPDVATATPARTRPLGPGVGGGGDGGASTTRCSGDRVSSTAGVTLLLGRRVEDGSRGDLTGEQHSKKAEQVITVMFDRSKFNEQEAQRWWTANRARIESIGDPRK